MDANVLQSLFCECDAHKEEIYDRAADRFLNEVHKALSEQYDNDEWAEFVGCTQLGISLQMVDKSFREFVYSFGWILKGETLEKDYEMQTFEEFLAEAKWNEGYYECCGYQDEDIATNLQLFVKALQRKKFEVYYDKDGRCLIVALNISYDQK